jgi:hypothetical protein
MRSILKALVGLSLLVVSGVAHAQPSTGTLSGPVVVVPTVTSDAYTIGSTAGQLDFGNAVILTNTGDTDADTWTLPDCDSAISGTAPYAPKFSTLGMVINVLENTAVASALVISPQALDQIQGLTTAVNVDITSGGRGSFVSLVCAADDLWVPVRTSGFLGDAVNVNMSGSGFVSFITNIATLSPTAGDLRANVVYNNLGDADNAIINFPDCTAATVGATLTYIQLTTTVLQTIGVAASDTIGGAIAGAAAGDDVANTTTPIVGDAIQVVCTAADVLTVVYETGDWDDL